jgi:hypothetical protein
MQVLGIRSVFGRGGSRLIADLLQYRVALTNEFALLAPKSRTIGFSSTKYGDEPRSRFKYPA